MLENCNQCGQLFIKSKKNICNKCQGENRKQLALVNSYLKKIPDISINELNRITKLSPDAITRLVSEQMDSKQTCTEINCKICGKLIPGNSRRLVCSNCLSQLAKNTSGEYKVKQLRLTLVEKDKRSREFEKNNQKPEPISKSFGFKNSLKEHFGKYITAREMELLPDLSFNYKYKLSNRYCLSPVPVYRY